MLMKKILTLALTVIMLVALASAAMARTIWFVSPGASIDLEKVVDPAGDYMLKGSYGINEKVFVQLAYTNSDPDALIAISGWYALSDQFDVTLDYQTKNDASATLVGLRARTALNDNLTLAGQLDYNTDTEVTNLLAQAEYKMNEVIVANAGVEYNSTGDGFTFVVVGGEFKINNNWVPYLDYTIPTESGIDNTLTAGVTYHF
jgi:hypothetical protein